MYAVRVAPVGKTLALEAAQLSGGKVAERLLLDLELGVDEVLDLRQEPRIDPREVPYLLERHADAERVGDVPEALGARVRELVLDLVRIDALEIEPVDADFQAAQRF